MGAVTTEAPVRETLTLNMGPQHPSTHGVLRVQLELEGEEILRATPMIGYLHTGIEKTHEAKTYLKGLPMTDRLDYLSANINNLAYVLSTEALLGLEVPKRAQYLRVIMAELARVASHLVWLGTHALDLGAMTVFLYCFREREQILDLFEMIAGARMMPSYIRPGGVREDVPPGFEEQLGAFLDDFPKRVDEYEALLTDNQIWIMRTKGVGRLTRDQALDLSVTGPSLRACGVAWDLRKTQPHSGYEEFDFEVAVREEGDSYARYLVRIQEMRESVKIIRQALDGLPGPPLNADDPKVVPPPKDRLYQSMEALIYHFMIWTEGFTVPPGEAYVPTEGPRGEVGFYIVSDGSPKPYRVKMRAPSFIHLQAFDPMVRGHLVADAVTVIGSIDIVLGEVDR